MTRVLSGITPSNQPSLGNYLGAMRRWAQDQHRADNFFFIADLHGMTTEHDPVALRERTLGIANWLLAVGLDPDVCTIYVQSHISEHTELGWLLECTARFGELRRMTQFKDKGGESEGVRASLFTYPCLMAADILLYDADEVPVGEDQRQHLELTRDVAHRFNTTYGDTFVMPKATLPAAGARVMDLQDPTRKMSKSEDSPGVVRLFDDPKVIERKIKRAVTDASEGVSYDPEKGPGVANLLDILGAATARSPEALAGEYTQYGPLKSDTAAAVIDLLTPVQARYRELSDEPGETLRLLADGADKARRIAAATLRRAQENIGLLLPQ